MNTTIFMNKLAESQNVLKYSLYLQFEENNPDLVPIMNTPSSKWLEDVSNRTLDCCKVLLNDGNPNFWELSPDKPIRNDLSILSSYIHFESFWKPMLQHHGIISAFVKLRKLIGDSNGLTSYGALLYSQFFKDRYHHGLDYLIANGCLKLEPTKEGTISLTKLSKKNDSIHTEQTDISPRSTNYGKSIICFSKAIHEFSNLSINNLNPPYTEGLTKSSDYRYPIHFLEFNDLLIGNTKFLRSALYSYRVDRPSLTAKRFKNYKKLRKEFFNFIDSNDVNYSLSDKLYIKYQFEYYFNFDMIDCLFQNINRIKQAPFNYDLTTQSDLDTLLSCFLLPNIFSRQYLVQMAFDALKNNYNIEESFFYTYKENVDVVASKTNFSRYISNELIKLSSWKDLYNKFIQYLTAFFFPVYEDTFFVTLYNDFKSSYPEKSDAERLAELYLILSQYLSQENVYNDILSMDSKIIESENNNISRQETLKGSLKKSIKFPFPNDYIIHPKFELSCPESELDAAALYSRCMKAANKQSASNHSPDFISLDYLKSLLDKSDERIRAYYVVESAASHGI